MGEFISFLEIYLLVGVVAIFGVYLFFRISSFAVLKSYFQLKKEESRYGENTRSEKKRNAGGVEKQD